jgi:hypothetical protein
MIARDVNMSSAITLFARVAYTFFLQSNRKTRKKATINNSSVLCVVCEKCNVTFYTIVDRLLTDACNKEALFPLKTMQCTLIFCTIVEKSYISMFYVYYDNVIGIEICSFINCILG